MSQYLTILNHSALIDHTVFTCLHLLARRSKVAVETLSRITSFFNLRQFRANMIKLESHRSWKFLRKPEYIANVFPLLNEFSD